MADNKKKKVPVVPARPGTSGKAAAQAAVRKLTKKQISQMSQKEAMALYKKAFPKAFKSGKKWAAEGVSSADMSAYAKEPFKKIAKGQAGSSQKYWSERGKSNYPGRVAATAMGIRKYRKNQKAK